MTDRFKFRAWDVDSKRWCYFTIGTTWDIQTKEIYNSLCLEGEKFYQCTGLKDKNGKEIYEGDIVRPRENKTPHAEPLVILYLDHGFTMGLPDDTDSMDCIWYFNVEIIGNIYESPELLSPPKEEESNE